MRRVSFACVLVVLGGCGLVLDAAPPRRDAGLDARPMDASMEPRPDVYVEPGVDAALDVFEPPMPDAGLDSGTDPFDGGGIDAGPPDPCAAAVDGEGCGDSPRRICVGGRCVVAGCGDGFVEGEEACEPSGDPACNELTCQWQCNDALQCETGTPCLVGSCVAHACVYEERAVACTDATGNAGTCRGGACLLTSCGNGRVEPGEECDVRAGVPGCIGCRFACNEHSECDDGDGCNGPETCAEVLDGLGTIVGRHCQRASGPTCTTSDLCRVSECVSVDGTPRCEERLIDGDGDGFGADARCGADCDDTNPLRNPGSPEICNGLDDDCDGLADEVMAVRTWCRDADGDGFGDLGLSMDACEQPPGFVADCSDCFDAEGPLAATARLVNPAQLAFFSTPYVDGTGSTSFDYDCSGDEDEEFRESVSCNALLMFECNSTRGWQGSVPGCGEPGSFATCRGIGPLLCSADVATRAQRCR